MTIRIPLRLVLFFLYTAAVLGGAFGISYAVFEWRDDDASSDSGITLESVDGRINDLDGRIGSVSNRVTALSTASGSNDSSACHAALKQLTLGIFELLLVTRGGSVIPPSIENNLLAQEDVADQNC